MEFILNETKVTLPDSWNDVNWKKFKGFADLVKGFVPRSEESEGKAGELDNALMDLEDNTKILCYWTGLSEENISMIDLDTANEVMKHLEFLNEKYDPIHIEKFTLEEETYFLPKEFMKKSSFGRYIEAEQLDIQSNMLKEGNLGVLPRQIAILCKKEGEEEKIDDAIIDKRARLFEELDMATIWDVAFFLTKLEQKLMIHSLISLEMEEMLKQEGLLKQQ
ncbi:MAG: hypothetical protein Unbinned1473contig1002_48 [Prokaryotic dsDNA virus sp.]|nr:MAG: hypothetical protein Unbinned1473contig1002_48 [Prokaryotic dsDNA virus sp.]|tara:strand:- start:7524 stop:8186 length:663 start_codon:yes stop_codon:yes gene_type:complete